MERSWNIRFTSEFNVTNDAALIRTTQQLVADEVPSDWKLIRADLRSKGYLPLLGGEQVHHYKVNWETIGWWVSESEGRQRLHTGLQGKRVDSGASFDYEDWRVTVRRKARNTDSRTLIGTVLPRGVFSTYDNQHSVRWSTDGGRPIQTASSNDLLYLNGILSSICLDWLARLVVEDYVTIGIVHALPVPRRSKADAYERISTVVAHLLARDEDYRDLWMEVTGCEWSGVGIPTTDDETARLKAEIDGLVAHLYGINRHDFCHILGLPYPGAPAANDPFPLVARETKEAALEAYDRLAPHYAQGS